jgi:adenylate cyclase
VRTSPRLRNTFLYALVMAVAALGSVLPSRINPFEVGERWAYDRQMNLLRTYFPSPVENDVVVIGTDAATEQVFLEPIALWHRHFGRTYAALAAARPAVVAVDFGLPERSFDWLLTEQEKVDKEIMKGLVMLRSSGTPIVFVQHIRDTGEVAPIQDNFRSLVPPENLGIDRHIHDPDGVSRRFDPAFLRDEKGEPLPTLAGRVLRALGRSVQEGERYIDYSVGDTVRYVPMQDVNRWSEAGDVARLRALFAGRIVLIGSMGGATDRWPLPVKVIDLLEDKTGIEGLRQPGVMIHAQVLRSHLANGMLVPMEPELRWILCALAAFAVFVHARPWMLVTGAVAFPLLLTGASMFAIRHSQVLLPVASLTLCFWIALVIRAAFDAVEATLERMRMHRQFVGQVSPGVMREMLHGDLTPGSSGQVADICVLFSDVRDFTTLSEKMPPEIVTAVLQRYFDRMVRAVHKFNGTVDKFIGDGLMVLFGAPRKSADACGDAVRCALEMMSELDALNAEFQREGLPTLTIGIGVNYGSVTVGFIGSSERHNYSAIGDAVNVAARVEGLTKDLGRKIVITEAVVSRIEDKFHFDPLGEHKVKGHSPVKVWGIRTARATPAAA